jgi:hypothetical protein
LTKDDCLGLPYTHDKKRGHLPLIDNKKIGNIRENEVKRAYK